jgi:Holliday junction DNA helicase RuvA
MPLARLRGVVEEKGPDWVIVGVGGMGIVASVPTPAADELRPGANASLFTYLHVREDALTLYGFTSRDELTLFEQLIGVSGVGPRAALGLLSALDGPRLATAIASGHTDLLRKVPGIGQKTAERLVLELRDKVAVAEDVPPPSLTRQGERQPDAELVAALIGLGYTQAEAVAAAERVPDDGDVSLEDSIRAALMYFGAPTT